MAARIRHANAIPGCSLQGRLFWWAPGSVDNKKALPASHPEVLARFVKEGSTSKAELFPDIDSMDVTARNEPLRVRGEPQMALWERVRRAGFVLGRLCAFRCAFSRGSIAARACVRFDDRGWKTHELANKGLGTLVGVSHGFSTARIHKTQALSIRHVVQGCLEGVFAQGQVFGTSESHAHR